MADENCFLCKGKGVVTRKADGKTVPCNFCADGSDAELTQPAPANVVPTTALPLPPAPFSRPATGSGPAHAYSYNGVNTIIREVVGLIEPGVVGFIDDTMQCEGETLQDCQAAFEEAVDVQANSGSPVPTSPPKRTIVPLTQASAAVASALGIAHGSVAATSSGTKTLQPIKEKTTIGKLMSRLGGHRRSGKGQDSRVMIAFTDTGGGVDVQVQFEPEPVPGEPLSPAQAMAGELMNLLSDVIAAGGMNAVEMDALDADAAMALEAGLLTPDEIKTAKKQKLEAAFAGLGD